MLPNIVFWPLESKYHLSNYLFLLVIMIVIKQLDSDWSMNVDNEFALNLYSSIQQYRLAGLPLLRQPSRLCDHCRALKIWGAGFTARFDVNDLKSRAQSCDLCNLFLKTCIKGKGESFRTVTFVKVGSILTMDESAMPVLFLCQNPGQRVSRHFS